MGLGFLIGILWKVIVLCFVYAFICEGIEVLIWFIKCLIVDKYNYYTTKFQRKVEHRTVVPYTRSLATACQVIDISSLLEVTPKLVAHIDIMSGKVQTKQVWKKRGISEKFIRPWNQGMAQTTVSKIEKETVDKNFVYVQSLINTLNFNYPNWQEFNPHLWEELQNEKIVAEEVLVPYLHNFQC